ncbi:MAG: hypothetical protein ACLU84_01060 [Clostridia bacterium]
MINIKNEHVMEEINAKKGRVVARKMLPLHFLQYEAIVNYITEEPAIVLLSETEQSEKLELEQILRIRFWIPNKQIVSWCLYSTDRQINLKSKIVVRKVIWDRENDLKYFKDLKIEERENLKDILPRVSSNTAYISKEDKEKLIKEIEKLDSKIGNGINLNKVSTKTKEHNFEEIEIKRLYDWGSINSIWNIWNMQNKEVESLCENLVLGLEKDIVTSKEVYKIELDYTFPIAIYKEMIY